MPAATVTRADFEAHRLPHMCVKTGESAQCLVPAVAYGPPRWSVVLLLLGGAPYFLARAKAFPHAAGALPAKNLVWQRLQYYRRGVGGCAGVAAVVALWALVTLNIPGMVLAWATAMAVSVGWLAIVPRVWVRAELEGETVRLLGLHPDTVRAFGR